MHFKIGIRLIKQILFRNSHIEFCDNEKIQAGFSVAYVYILDINFIFTHGMLNLWNNLLLKSISWMKFKFRYNIHTYFGLIREIL